MIFYSHTVLFQALFPMAARSKLWFCGRSLDGIADSNPDGGMEVSALVCCACVVI